MKNLKTMFLTAKLFLLAIPLVFFRGKKVLAKGETVLDAQNSDIEWLAYSMLLIFFVTMLFVIVLFIRLMMQKRKTFHSKYRDNITGFYNISGLALRYKRSIKKKVRPMYAAVVYEGNPEFLKQFYQPDEITLLLKIIAHEVSACTKRKYDYSARINQYSFCTIKQYYSEHELISWTQNLAQKLVEASEKLNKIQIMRPNFGIYFLKQSDDDFEQALYNAMQTKTYAQKKDLVYAVCKTEVLNETIEFGALEKEAILGLARQEFVPYFQPIVDFETKEIVAVEALARWNHKKYGLLPPSKFVPQLENNGMILKLDLYIFEKVCEFVADRYSKGKKMYVVSCNFSRLDFKQKDFTKKIKSIISKYNTPPEYLAIEMTETSIIRADEEVFEQLKELKKMNFKLYVDDFGAGYTSFKDFCEYPIDVIKIDKSIVRNVEQEKWRVIVEGIATLAKNLGYSVVCEGVESTSQMLALKGTGCVAIQGHYFYKPMPQKDLEKTLKP